MSPPGQSAMMFFAEPLQVVQVCAVTVKPAACSFCCRYATVAVWPAVPVARLPPLLVAMVCSCCRWALTLLTSIVGGAASRATLIAAVGEPDGRTPGEAAAGWAPSASAVAAKTAMAGPAVTVLSLMRGS